MGVRGAVKQHEHETIGGGVSLLLASVQMRLAVVAGAVGFLWLAVLWALR
jgi:hypothetical protein